MSHSGRTSRRNGRGTTRSAKDRRISYRYPAAIKDLILSMMHSCSQVDHCVELENVSMQGCLLTSRLNPGLQRGEKVWLKAFGEISTPVMDGVVVSAVKPLLGKCTIRIRFLAPLSYQTFKMLVYGKEEVDQHVTEQPAYENDQFWR
jgi:hypothetical protein